MKSTHPRLLALTLRCIAFVQAFLGIGFLAAPEVTTRWLGLQPAPAWTNWLFGMMAARFLGYGWCSKMASAPWRRDDVAKTMCP